MPSESHSSFGFPVPNAADHLTAWCRSKTTPSMFSCFFRFAFTVSRTSIMEHSSYLPFHPIAIKQRLQIFNSPYHNSLDCLLHVIRIEGPSALYRAYFTQLTMNVPYQAIHFVTYEAAQGVVNPSRLYQPWTHVFSGGLAGCLAAALTNPLDVCKTALNTQVR